MGTRRCICESRGTMSREDTSPEDGLPPRLSPDDVITPDIVHNVAFKYAPFRLGGYDQMDVDDVLDRIEATMRGTPSITLAELRAVRFRRPPIGKPGYSKEEVNTFVGMVLDQWPPE